jgi:hypothetical protein
MKKFLHKNIRLSDYEIPRTVKEFKEWFDLQLQQVPEEYRNEANLQLETYYDSARIEIYWSQLETDEEEQARLKLELQQEEKRKQEQFELFMKLKTEIQRDRPEMYKAMYEEFKEQIGKGTL